MSNERNARRKALISGAGIAGLTLAIQLRQHGWTPVIVERDAELRTEGYMMDFFGTGWDVAERMELTEPLRAIKYPIERLEFVDREGAPYITVPIDRVRDALDNRYVYLRRPDLLRILLERAAPLDLDIRFATTIAALKDGENEIVATFASGESEAFDLVFGADGVHSRVRELAFGAEETFTRFLGGYVAAFHIPESRLDIKDAFKLHEEIDRTAGLYPLGANQIDATFIIRHTDMGHLAPDDRWPLLREKMSGPGWISERLRDEIPSAVPVFFDSLTQVRMPNWTHGRVALLGDACGCLTLLAGQGSQLAMAGGYVLAAELERQGDDHRAAFRAYEEVLWSEVTKRQRDAERFAGIAIRSRSSWPWLRRWVTALSFSRAFLPFALRQLGGRSALAGYRA